jgi:tetratricopeptide (TPR) repeat protein
MRIEILRGVCVAMVLAGSVTGLQARQAPTTAPAPVQGQQVTIDPGDAALAERICGRALQILESDSIKPQQLRLAAAMLAAANRLNMAEPRFPRLQAEAAMQLNDSEQALAALNAYRMLGSYYPEVADDRLAQTQVIELHTAAMDAAEKKVEYLRGLVNTPQLLPEVRAVAAVNCAKILQERAQNTEAMEMIGKALEANPLNMDALRINQQRLMQEGQPDQRVANLLLMLRANPAQPQVMSALGAECAMAGFTDTAAGWYQQSFSLSNKLGMAVNPTDVTNYISLLLASNKADEAWDTVRGLLAADPTSAEGAMMNLLVLRRLDPDISDDAARAEGLELARQVMTTRLSMLSEVLAGKTPTTQRSPSDPPATMPDIAADANRLKGSDNAELVQAYADTLSDFAFIELYFPRAVDRARPLIDAARVLYGEQHPKIARLDGQVLLLENKLEEAKVRLGAAAEADPLARMLLLNLGEKNTEAAWELIEQHPAGVLGSFLRDGLHEQIVGTTPPTPDFAEAVRKQVASFPGEWLGIIEDPKKFYQLRAEPHKVTHYYGDALVATVILTNISNYPLVVGPEGAVRPDLWFDVEIRGIIQRPMRGVAYDRLGHKTMLPGESMIRTVRLDQGALAGALRNNPTLSIPMFFSVQTNPTTISTGVSPGLMGQRAQFAKVMERVSSPLNEKSRDSMLSQISTGTPEVKIRQAELFTAFLERMRASDNPQPVTKFLDDLQQSIEKLRRDPNPAVRSWALYQLAKLQEPEKRLGFVQTLLRSEHWQSRLMATAVISTLPRAQWKGLLQPIAEQDPEPILRNVASAMAEVADLPEDASNTDSSAEDPALRGSVPEIPAAPK